MASSMAKLGLVFFMSFFALNILKSDEAYAQTCSSLGTGNGKITETVNISTAGSHAVWIRLKALSSSDGVIVSADGTGLCDVTMGNGSVNNSSWTWVNTRLSGGSAVTASFPTGNVNVQLAGTTSGVRIDNILLVSSGSGCVPSGDGSNCPLGEDGPTPTPGSTSTPVPTPTVEEIISGNSGLDLSDEDIAVVSRDSDNDGIVDYEDPDDDNDGIVDEVDDDDDGDGIKDEDDEDTKALVNVSKKINQQIQERAKQQEQSTQAIEDDDQILLYAFAAGGLVLLAVGGIGWFYREPIMRALGPVWQRAKDWWPWSSGGASGGGPASVGGSGANGAFPGSQPPPSQQGGSTVYPGSDTSNTNQQGGGV